MPKMLDRRERATLYAYIAHITTVHSIKLLIPFRSTVMEPMVRRMGSALRRFNDGLVHRKFIWQLANWPGHNIGSCSTRWKICSHESFQEPGRSSPAGKILVKEAPEMLAIAHWTSQIPKRPPLPDGCSVDQLIALGSRRRKSKVYWMLAQSPEEVA